MKQNVFLPMLLVLFIVTQVMAQVVPDGAVPVKAMLQPYIDSGDLAGVVTVIATKDKVLQTDSVGYADCATKKPIGPDSLFWIASQSKTVTAVAVMILVDEGKLSLDEPVTKYLPEMKDLQVIKEKTDSQTILVPVEKQPTLRQLLSHTAGFAFLTPIQHKHRIDSLPSGPALTSYVMTPMIGQPGTKYHYSNIGINIAATVVERVSGKPLDVFMQKRIFDPLGMKETTFYPTTEQTERLAKTYRWDKEKNQLREGWTGYLTKPYDNKTGRFPEGGGGLFSTPNDFVKFYQMLAGEGEFEGKRILSAEAVKTIRTKQTGDIPNNYGLGVNISGDVYGHGGALGTDGKINAANGKVALYFVQEEGIPKSGEAKNKFFQAALK